MLDTNSAVFLQAEMDREEEDIALDPVRADIKALDDKMDSIKADVVLPRWLTL